MWSTLLVLAACNGKDGESGGVAPDVPSLVINEFLARNDTVNADPAGEFDDWVELYNSGTAPLSFAGLYLTDDRAASPTKWALPETGTLQPGEFKLVWCDGQIDQGEDHTSFRLSSAGEEISIFLVEAGSEVQVDAIDYEAQAPDVSYARVPDGSEEIDAWVQASPTPGASNG